MAWEKATFDAAFSEDVAEVQGHVYAGLGLFPVGNAADDPIGQLYLPCEWSLTHLASGHLICRLIGTRVEVYSMANRVAALAEWDAFTAPDGWKNVEPSLGEKIGRLAAELRGRMIFPKPNKRPEHAAVIARKRDA